MAAAPPPFSPGYYVFHNGNVKGPYDLAFIEAMVISALLPPDVTVSRDGKIGWERLDVLVQPPRSKSPLPEGIRLNDPAMPQSPPPVPPRPAQTVPVKGTKNYGCLYLFLGLLGFGFISSLFKQSPAPYHPTYQPPANAQQVQPSDQPPANTQPVYQPTYLPPSSAQPVYQPSNPPVQNYSMTGANGQIYIVSDADYQTLSPRKTQLDAWSTKIDNYKSYCDALGRQIEADRSTVDNTSQESVDLFNLEVKKYNDSNAQLQTAIDSYNTAVDSFNSDLARVGRPSR